MLLVVGYRSFGSWAFGFRDDWSFLAHRDWRAGALPIRALFDDPVVGARICGFHDDGRRGLLRILPDLSISRDGRHSAGSRNAIEAPSKSDMGGPDTRRHNHGFSGDSDSGRFHTSIHRCMKLRCALAEIVVYCSDW